MTETELAASPLLAPLFATAEMRALHADRAVIGRMLAVEAALARAEAAADVIPRAAAPAIKFACNPARFDPVALGKAAALAGNPAIPLVKALTAEVARRNREAARYVHWGATSQDVIDTAAVIAIGESVALLDRDLRRAINAFASLARKHRKTPLAARTWLQGPPRKPPSCNSAAQPVRSRHSGKRVRRSPSASPRSSTFCSMRPGTRNATASRVWRAPSAS